MDADANGNGDGKGDAVTKPIAGGSRSTGTGTGTSTSTNPNRIHVSNSASTSSLTSHSTSTASLHSTTSPRTIKHYPSFNSLRNINTGGGSGAAQNAAIAGAALAFSKSNLGKADLGNLKATSSVSNRNRVLLNSGKDGGNDVRGGMRGDVNANANTSANTYSGKDRALAAAAKVGARGPSSAGKGVVGAIGGRTRSSSKASILDESMAYKQQMMGKERTEGSDTTDGGSIGGGSEYQGQKWVQKRTTQRSNAYLQPPFSSGTSTPELGLSAKNSTAALMAANMAASMAAKRSMNNSPNRTGQSQGIGFGGGKQASPISSRRQSYASSIDSAERRLDVSNIHPTRSLVGMWEQTESEAVKGRGGGGGGNETMNRQESPRRRPVSSHAPIPASKPAVLARPVSSHAPIPEEMKSTAKPPVQPQPSSQAPMSGQLVSTSKPPVRSRPVSSHTAGSEIIKPSPKPPAQKLVIHNTRPASSHGPLPDNFSDFSTKPTIQQPSRPVSAHVLPLMKPLIQSVRPTSSHALEVTESSSKPPVQKPSLPPPRRTSTNVPASENQSKNSPMQAPRPLSMHTSFLNPTDSADSTDSSKRPTQSPRRASTIKTPPKSSRPTPPIKPAVSKSSYNNNDDDKGSSDDSFVSASSQPKPRSPSWRAKLAQQNRRQSSYISDVNSLADAIVAGSLASSRASTPSIASGTVRPPPPPTRRHKNKSLFHSDTSRTPTPPQIPGSGNPILKTTMRKPKTEKELKEEGEGEKRRAKKHLVKKHPNKHHEGDRKRWRDVITEKEKKRYEAVWASNRGLFPFTVTEEGNLVEVQGAGDSVPGVVVRELWDRSRLPADVLEEVWGLVEGRRNVEGNRDGGGHANMRGVGGGRLGKEEFVVGLWLIDQRLKGRKLPGRVGKSVWGSAGGMGGIIIRDLGR